MEDAEQEDANDRRSTFNEPWEAEKKCKSIANDNRVDRIIIPNLSE
jgi:hypothetical protein